MAAAALLVLIAVAAGFLAGGRSDVIFQAAGKDATLTGRTYLWQFCAQAIQQNPLLGSGWDVFWSGPGGDRIRGLAGWDAPHGHNAFIDFSLNAGVVGLGLFLLALFDCIRRSLRYDRAEGAAIAEWPLLFYVFVFLYMFTETITVDRHSLFQIMFCALSVAVNRRCAVPVEFGHEPAESPAFAAAVAGVIEEN
jgi:O-antigen ligase